MSKKLSPLQESIFILITLQALLIEYNKCLKVEKDNEKSILFSIITSQIILTSCSYLDEWETLGCLSKQEPKIIVLRKIVKPAIDRVYRWKDMKLFRNTLIAHNHRIRKQNNESAVFNLEKKLNCPKSFYDYQLLMGCIFVTKNILIKVFANEYNLMIPYLSDIENIESIEEIKNRKVYNNQFNMIIENVQNNFNDFENPL